MRPRIAGTTLCRIFVSVGLGRKKAPGFAYARCDDRSRLKAPDLRVRMAGDLVVTLQGKFWNE